MSTIEVRELRVSFPDATGEHVAVDHVSLEVEKGEVFGLVGESGCGKTTIIRCISGMHNRWSGSISLEGSPVGPLRTREQRRRVQVVFQDPYSSLHPRRTVYNSLEEPLKINDIPDHRNRIERAIGEVGMATGLLYRYPHQLSGGQRQRVSIARALILEPEILLLDEPTSALDVSVQAEILNLLSDLRDKKGLSYLMVSHDLAVVAHMCDRIAVMKKGRVVEMITSDELRRHNCSHPYTEELFAASLAEPLEKTEG